MKVPPTTQKVDNRRKTNADPAKGKARSVKWAQLKLPSTSWRESGRRLVVLKTTIAIALICGFALSWRLWISSRLFPLSPVSQLLPTIPSPLDKLWLSVLIGMALAIAVVVRPRRLTVCFLGLAGLLSLWDQNRWQPWFYQYFFMLAATVFARRMPETQNHQ